MTWIEKEVPSLELCKKLKELGFPQEGGGFWWWEGKSKDGKDMKHLDFYKVRPIPLYSWNYIKAPTCRELGEWLLKVYLKLPTGHPVRNKLISFCSPLKLNPNILSKDLIWLAENGYIRFRRVNK